MEWKAECVGVTDLGGNGHDVYEIVSVDGHARICEYVSDAHAFLIAAAPEMLEMLNEVQPFLPDELRIKVGKLITKAEGK